MIEEVEIFLEEIKDSTELVTIQLPREQTTIFKSDFVYPNRFASPSLENLLWQFPVLTGFWRLVYMSLVTQWLEAP